jgi:hypothetical protein
MTMSTTLTQMISDDHFAPDHNARVRIAEKGGTE